MRRVLVSLPLATALIAQLVLAPDGSPTPTPTPHSTGSRSTGLSPTGPRPTADWPASTASRPALVPFTAGSTAVQQARTRLGAGLDLDPALLEPGPATVALTAAGDVAAVRAAITSVGGRVLAAVPGMTSAQVPRSAVRALAARPGVGHLAPAVRAVIQDVSQGVHTSGADTWINAGASAGNGGAGVTVGIVDGGFGGLATEVAAGHLPADTVMPTQGNRQDMCDDINNSEHGTAVAEIVHQMAPNATIVLYCVDDEVGFQAAGQALVATGVKIVNSSLGFPGDSRGDGTGDATSTATTVRKARQAGILWVQSAGNNGEDHWHGVFAPLNRVDSSHSSVFLASATDPDTGLVDKLDYDAVQVLPGPTSSGLAVLQWDSWPTNTLDVQFGAIPYDPDTGRAIGDPVVVSAVPAAGGRPELEIGLPSLSDSATTYWQVSAAIGNGTPRVRYDLSYWGDVTDSYLAFTYPTAAAQGSITEPASSPFALAVGATYWGDRSLEKYSSQGPTIDGRTKPDLAGDDCVSSYLDEFGNNSGATDPGGFCGTSAAAPHVAGAAALLQAADPTLDAAQIQTELQRRAGDPAGTDQFGHGPLTLGAPATPLRPTPQGFTPLAAPVPVLDTRGSLGGHPTPLGPKSTVTVSVAAAGVPSDATAVAVNLTGISAYVGTFVTAYPTGSALPATSNLDLAPGTADRTAAAFAMVTLGTDGTLQVYNNAGSINVVVAVLGYVSPSSAGLLTPTGPTRVLDTRITHQRLSTGGALTLTPAAIPAGATAAVITVAAVHPAGAGVLSVTPIGSTKGASVNYASGVDRANLVLVQLTGRSFSIHDGGGSADVVADLVGYFGSTGSGYVALPSPERIVDSRVGIGLRRGQFGSNTAQLYQGSGFLDLPARTTALVSTVTGIASSGSGYDTVYPYGTDGRDTSTLNITPNRVVSNGALVGLSSSSYYAYNRNGLVHLLVDVSGYFLPVGG